MSGDEREQINGQNKKSSIYKQRDRSKRVYINTMEENK